MFAVANSVNSFNVNGTDQMPQILNDLKGGGDVLEGEPVHMELSIDPLSELQIQWYKDGVPLSAGL